ncbi:hypothetical protein Syun_020861 [Stephania yunnanensis]|uniref:Uncharacterized protein n=1 Tax=Stephania yunnanensis TaxID=152371 RepID=A0AAP0IEL7_9MAGN
MIRSSAVKRLHLLYGASPSLGGKRRITISSAHRANQTSEESLVVVGGGAAGVYGAIRAKSVSPNLRVLVVEKGKPLSKVGLLIFHLIDYIVVAVIANGVKISGGGRCNVTNGHCLEHKVGGKGGDDICTSEYHGPVYIGTGEPNRRLGYSGKFVLQVFEFILAFVRPSRASIRGSVDLTSTDIVPNLTTFESRVLAEHYPRGKREFQGPFFVMHGPADTMSWFMDHGVNLKTEDDGRVFPVSNSSSSIIDCLMLEADRIGGKVVTSACTANDGKFHVKIEKRTVGFLQNVEADYLLIASGSSQQGYDLATQLGHSIVNPVPSLFTFKIVDKNLAELSGVSMGMLLVDFILDIHIEDAKGILLQHKIKFALTDKHMEDGSEKSLFYFWQSLDLELMKQKVINSFPPEFGLVKRFWKYLLDRECIDGETFWASISNNSLISLCSLLKNCSFNVTGKGQFKDEFVTAGGVLLSEISLQTMESKITPRLFFAGEVLNVDGETGGFNFQNAWSGGYIAGTSIGKQAAGVFQKANLAY